MKKLNISFKEKGCRTFRFNKDFNAIDDSGEFEVNFKRRGKNGWGKYQPYLHSFITALFIIW